MVTMGKIAHSLETSAEPNLHHQQNDHSQNQNYKISGYEKCREERIKENLERMHKLGIIDLSLKLKTNTRKPQKLTYTPSNRKTPNHLSPLPPSAPVRRSSRLGNVNPVSYSEVHLPNKGSFEMEEVLLTEGSKPEVYTEEHEKLLGSTNMSWTLFVDGYGKDGKRIYDPVRGKTCHQCRQKTLGYRTECSRCNKVQGQFCGDCLYMRYGENVLEAKQNPDWICPVCRGICNCSLCRQAKGWPPTGIMYKRVLLITTNKCSHIFLQFPELFLHFQISNLGYKSVAHYLIQTHRSTSDLEEDLGTRVPVSAKKSLSFLSIEAPAPLMKESAASYNDLKVSTMLEFDNNITNEHHKGEKEEMMPISDGELNDPESTMPASENDKPVGVNDEHIESSVKVETSPESAKVPSMVKEHIAGIVPEAKSCPDPSRISELAVTYIDEHQVLPIYEGNDIFTSKEESMQFLDKHCDDIAAKGSATGSSKRKARSCTEPMPDSIGTRLRQRRKRDASKEASMQLLDNHCDIIVVAKGSATGSSKRKARTCAEPMPDSIGARLRRRHRRDAQS